MDERPEEQPTGTGGMHRRLALAQGVYYLLTGIWAIVHRPSFEAITGPKTDYWLVVTVSLQICAIGLTLVVFSARPKPATPVYVLGTASATGFLVVDVVYPVLGIIAKTYLLDAAPQAVFIFLWAWLWKRGRPR